MVTRIYKKGWFMVAVLAASLTVACSKKEESFSSASKKKKSDEETKEIDVDGEKRGVEGIDSYQALRGAGFIVKNYLQLKAAARVCLGANLGVVEDSMFTDGRCENQQAAVTPAPGNEIKAILGVDKCDARGKNIYDALKNQLWAPELAGRTDTLSNELTPAYLQALAQAADVYAHTVDQPGDLCDTLDKTKELMTRCLAQFPAAQVEPLAEDIHNICKGGALDAREAIATILGSAAFAAASPSNAATGGK